jgi:hypothetical protein
MKHFYDLEFLENGHTIELISIGIVSDDGSEYYAVNSDIQTDKDLHERISEHDFLAKEVIKHLPLVDDHKVAEQLKAAAMSKRTPYFEPSSRQYTDDATRLDWELDMTDIDVKPKWVIANEVQKYFLNRLDHGIHDPEMDDEGEVELWANYGAYDHVGLMQLWGPMIKRPKNLPMFTHDLQHFAHEIGFSRADFPEQEAAKHDALADARHNQLIWSFLDAQRRRQEVGV